MSGDSFCNIHQHSQYSLLDGKSKIPDMVARAKELGQTSLGLCDHGSQFGLIEFYKECTKNNIKPILGNEFYLVEDHEARNEDGKRLREYSHLTVIAMNNAGLLTLNKLTTRSAQNFFYKPRISFKDLEELNEGLIVTSGCFASLISQAVLADQDEKAASLVKRFIGIFGDRFYIEVQNGGVPGQEKVTRKLRALAKKFSLKVMVSNDSHYVNKSDAFAHSIMLAINTNTKMSDKPTYEGGKRFAFSTDEYYMKGYDELLAEGWTKEELLTTREIADRTSVIIKPEMRLPVYPRLPKGATSMEYLRQVVKSGWQRKGIDLREGFDYEARLEKEFKDIESGGIADYFLIVGDYCRWARSSGIGIGDGRGSAAGSLVSYLTDITTIDPLRYGLYWERFWNAGRAKGSLPDIDSDFSQDRRQEVLAYIKKNFGEDRVVPIVSFNKMAPRLVLKDVGRALGVKSEEMNEITSQVPAKTNTIEQAIEKSPTLKEYSEKKYKKVFEVAKQLQNTARNTGVHPSALVLLDKPTEEGSLPMAYDAKTKKLITGYDMYSVEWLGLMKLDVLGLKNLDILSIATEQIKERQNAEETIEAS